MALVTPGRRGRRENDRPVLKVIALVLLTVLAIVTIAPFYFMFVFGTLGRQQIFTLPAPIWFGHDFFANYAKLLTYIPFWRNLWNSLYLAGAATITTMFFCTLAGFGFAMYRFRFRDQLFSMLLATLLIPPLLNLIPYYLIMNALHWIDTPRALYVPGMASAFGIFLMRQYIGSAIPRELLDAARIDGCTEFGIFWRIIIPLSRPALSTLGLITFIGQWNNFQGVLVIMRTQETFNAQVALRSLQGQANTEWGAIMAGTAITVLPLLIAFALASRQLIAGLTAGSVKS